MDLPRIPDSLDYDAALILHEFPFPVELPREDGLPAADGHRLPNIVHRHFRNPGAGGGQKQGQSKRSMQETLHIL